MDNLQYINGYLSGKNKFEMSFKPYYKWIIFNIMSAIDGYNKDKKVLNLIING